MVKKIIAGMVFAALLPAVHGEETKSDQDRIAALEQQVMALTGEVEKNMFGDVIPELGESVYGMGPSASKVYNKDQGLSIGGYGEVLYENHNGSDNTKTDQFDMLRVILYFGYKFNDKWVLNTEIEFEHANEAYVEFAYLDYLHSDALNFRGGLVLVPVGIVNELHEPTVFLSAKRSAVENRIIPTTWRENGGGIFGTIGPVDYKAYVVTSLDGQDFSDGGVRGGRQKGSKAKAENFSAVVRADWETVPGVIIGGSVYGGDQSQDIDTDANMLLTEAHIMARKAGATFNALVVASQIDDAAAFNDAIDTENGAALGTTQIAERMFGWYAELGYDVLASSDKGEHQLTPYVRVEQLDTQDKAAEGTVADPANDLDIVTVGLNYKPIDEIVFKLEHQFIKDGNGDRLDQSNLAMGYVF